MALGLLRAGSRTVDRPSRRDRARSGDRPRRQRGVALVCLVVAGTQTTWGLVIPVLPIYVTSLGASAAVMGAAVAVFGLGRILVNIPAGAATQRLNHRAMLVVGTALVALGTLATGYVDSVEQLLWMRFLTGLGGGIVVTTGQTMLSHTDPERLGRTMSVLQAFQMAGGALGPAIGGFLVGFGAGVPFIACGAALALLALCAALFALPGKAAHSEATAVATAGERGSAVWTRGLVAVSVVGFTIFFVRFGGQQFMFPVLAYEWAGLSPAVLGLFIAGSTALNLLLVRPSGILTDRWGRRRTVVAATLAVGICTLGFLGSGSSWVFLAALLCTGVAMAFTGPSTGAFLAESVPPDKRGTAVGIYRTAGDVAILVGPLSLGWLIEHGHTASAVVLLAVITVVVAVVFAVLTRPPAPVVPAPVTRTTPDPKERP